MTPPRPTDATSSEHASDDGTDQREETIADSVDRATPDPFAALNEAYTDPAHVGVLEGARAAVNGEPSHMWSALNDSARLRAV